MSKKTVLFILNNMNIGGTEKAFLNMMEEFDFDRFDVTLMLLDRWGGYLDMIPPRVKVVVAEGYADVRELMMKPPMPQIKARFLAGKPGRALKILLPHLWFKLTGNRLPYYRALLKPIVPPEHYDACVAYSGPFDIITTLALYINADKRIQWIHFDVSKFFINPAVIRHAYGKFDRIFTVSEQGRENFCRRFPQFTEKTDVVYNIVPRVSTLAAAGDTSPYPEGRGLRLLTVGRLTDEKGQKMIPEITAALASEGLDFVWYLIGDGKDKAEIAVKAEELGVSDRVVLLGSQANPYPYYRFADVYVQTSHHEGYCIALAEARLFRLPIVTTDFAGAREQIENGVSGIVTDDTPGALTAAVRRIFERELRGRFSKAIASKPLDSGDLSKLYEIIEG